MSDAMQRQGAVAAAAAASGPRRPQSSLAQLSLRVATTRLRLSAG